jgi:hypothetical protein
LFSSQRAAGRQFDRAGPGFQRAWQVHREAARLGEIGPGVAVERVDFEGAFQQRDLLGRVASGERERAGQIGAELRQLRIERERMAIRRIAKAKAGDGVIRLQLSNNGGECDGVVMAALLQKAARDEPDGFFVDGLQECCRFKPDGARFSAAVVLRQCGTLQENQECGPRRVAGVGNHMRHESIQAVARFFIKRAMVPSNLNAVCRTTPNR